MTTDQQTVAKFREHERGLFDDTVNTLTHCPSMIERILRGNDPEDADIQAIERIAARQVKARFIARLDDPDLIAQAESIIKSEADATQSPQNEADSFMLSACESGDVDEQVALFIADPATIAFELDAAPTPGFLAGTAFSDPDADGLYERINKLAAARAALQIKLIGGPLID